jgi:hypothetical protein
MINLDSPPAFGFQTETYRATDKYYKYFISTFMKTSWLVSAIDNIAGILLSKSAKGAEGLERRSNDQRTKTLIKEMVPTAWDTSNVIKKVAYIPLIGSVIGIQRISQTITDEKVTNKAQQILRGLVESFSLGVLLLPVDLFVDWYRQKSTSPTIKEIE